MSDPFSDPPQNKEDEADAQFEPVIKLTDQVQTKTHEEDEDVIFKMRAKLFRFESASTEWKERGTGELRLLAHKEHKKVRLVMRRDKTLKVCANHLVTSDMTLQPNIGSDRSWVYRCAADISEGEATSETLAVRFGNSDSANEFKTAFEAAQKINADLSAKTEAAAIPTATAPATEEPKPSAEEPKEPSAESAETKDAPEITAKTEESKAADEEGDKAKDGTEA
ncbi:RanBP1 domain-containing protein [Gautieria morchelliformis]|nr:RanBP1 domain-containing protein [Gautieria morchelliformis]